ncbi:MAG: hypothetical protein EA404_00180, partial [Spirochaetaceae bacterium]
MVKLLLFGLIAVFVLIGCAGAPQPITPQRAATTGAPPVDAAEPAIEFPTERPLDPPDPAAARPLTVELPEPRVTPSQPGRAAPSAPLADVQPAPPADQRAAARPAQRLIRELPLPRLADTLQPSSAAHSGAAAPSATEPSAERHPAAAPLATQPQAARGQSQPEPQPQPQPESQ